MMMKKKVSDNPTMIQYFEWYTKPDGGHWSRFADDAARLVAMGITAAWLPPAYKGTRGAVSEGYDVYDIYDLGEFDQKGSVRTRYGSKEDYVAAVKKARSAGLQVYIDVVLNHMGGAEETEQLTVRRVDPENRLKFTSDPITIEGYTRFRFPGRAGRHSGFTWDKECFTGIDYAADTKEESIFSIINAYGEDWDALVHDEKGNFDFLMLNDIETRNPAVRQELKNWIRWYHQTVPFDGVRLDAVKHMSPAFFTEWLQFIRAEIDPDIFALGEYWLSDDLPVLLKYLDVTGNAMSLFDAPLHHNIFQAAEQREQYDLRNIFHNTLVSARPELAVTFVDNHDTQPLQSLEEYTANWFRPHAYTLILLRQAGYPCVFLPDLEGTRYSGERNGRIQNVSLPAMKILPGLLELRRDKAHGPQVDYFDDPNCIGWTREGDEQHPCSGLVVLVSNGKNSAMKRMYAGRRLAGRCLMNVLSPEHELVTLNEEGMGEFTVEAAQLAVWVVCS